MILSTVCKNILRSTSTTKKAMSRKGTRPELLAFIFLACAVGLVSSHGRLLFPPSRASFGRVFDFTSLRQKGLMPPTNYDDNALYCGGAGEFRANNFQCGICGDSWSQPQPRDHERPGGNYVIKSNDPKDFVLSTFQAGETTNATVQITASHFGFFMFRVCNMDDHPLEEATESCLQYTVGVTNPQQTPIDHAGIYIIPITMPYIDCDHCFFQWRWVTANGGGENFYGCADISIKKNFNLAQAPSNGSYIPSNFDTTNEKITKRIIDYFFCNWCYDQTLEAYYDRLSSGQLIPPMAELIPLECQSTDSSGKVFLKRCPR